MRYTWNLNSARRAVAGQDHDGSERNDQHGHAAASHANRPRVIIVPPRADLPRRGETRPVVCGLDMFRFSMN